jgi:hypothetical protein
MADASKLKAIRRSTLGAPPSSDEARPDLGPEPASAPESSHATPQVPDDTDAGTVARSPQLIGTALASAPQSGRVDGRTMRRSGRTVQFATRVSPDFDERIRQIAMRDRLLLVEVLEQALEAYEASQKKTVR